MSLSGYFYGVLLQKFPTGSHGVTLTDLMLITREDLLQLPAVQTDRCHLRFSRVDFFAVPMQLYVPLVVFRVFV